MSWPTLLFVWQHKLEIILIKKMVSDPVQCEDAVSLSLHNAGSLDKKDGPGAAPLQALKGASLQESKNTAAFR